MNKIHNLEEYAFAKKIVNEVPNILKEVDKCHELLYTHKDYIDVAKVLQQLEEAKIMLELTLDVYTQILEKGAINE